MRRQDYQDYEVIEQPKRKKRGSKKRRQADWEREAQMQNMRRMPVPPSEHRQMASGGLRVLDVLATVALLGVVGYGVVHVALNMKPISDGIFLDTTGNSVSVATIVEGETKSNKLYENVSVSSEDYQKGPLILVNDNYGYTPYDDTEIVSIYDYKSDNYHVSGIDTSLRKPAIDALTEMLDEFYVATGHNDMIIISGYRSTDEQQELYDADLEKTGNDTSELVAQPGHSEHESGYALDFSLYDNGVTSDYDGAGEYEWLDQNCSTYGYILRYPEDKTDITNIQYEAWHYRYVGTPHANYIMENGLCLEEYIDLVRNYDVENPLEVEDWDGEIYNVYFTPVDESEKTTYVMVEEGLDYTISGNNVDGFITAVDTGKIKEFSEEEATTTLADEAEETTATE